MVPPAFLLMPLMGKLVQPWSWLHQHCIWRLPIIVDVHLNISLVIWSTNFNSMFKLRLWSNLTYNNFQTLQHHVFQLQYITLVIPSNLQKKVNLLYRSIKALKKMLSGKWVHGYTPKRGSSLDFKSWTHLVCFSHSPNKPAWYLFW
jgi:hypothetical protein